MPVEGEVKEGDTCIDKFGQKGVYRRMVNDEGRAVGAPNGKLCFIFGKGTCSSDNIEGHELKIIKPFVVTQDFEVGNEVVAKNGEKRFVTKLNNDNEKTFKDDGKVSKQNPSPHCYIKDYYKILGEVSTEATFVEDGKEYETKNNGFYAGGNKLQPLLVKCPCCKTFK